MDTAEVRARDEHVTVTGHEEKLLRQIVFHEPKGPLDRFLQTPLKASTGILKATIALVGVFLVVAGIYVADRTLGPRLDRLTSYANFLLAVAFLAQSVRISARERLIRKIYYAQDRKPNWQLKE